MELTLRHMCPEDIDLLYRWANDPVTRQNAFHTEQIPYETHKRWFAGVMQDDTVVLYICMDGNEPVGQLRFNLGEKEALVSYSVDAARRGQGVGTKLLWLAEKYLKEEHPEIKTLRGEVKYGNTASMRAFEKNGYCREEKEAFAVFEKKFL